MAQYPGENSEQLARRIGICAHTLIASVQDGDLLRFHAASLTWKPFRGATEDVIVGGITLHFVNGVYTGQS